MGASSSDPSHNIELRGSGWAVGRYVKGGSAGAKLQVPGMQSGAAGLCIFQLRNCASPPKPPPHWGRVRWGTWLVRSQFERPTKVADTTTSRGPWQGHRGLPVAKKQLKHTACRTCHRISSACHQDEICGLYVVTRISAAGKGFLG
jgi:hypothetical protein